MRTLQLVRPGRLQWGERPEPQIVAGDDALVRPFVASRCDGDWVAMSPAIRGFWAAQRLGLVDPIVQKAFGPQMYGTPCAIGHECVAEVIDVGPEVTSVIPGDVVIVPWSVSCGRCDMCRRGLTLKCTSIRAESGSDTPVACYGIGGHAGVGSAGSRGGMIADLVHVPYADHMLTALPSGVDPIRAAAASDSFTDGWSRVSPHLRARPGATVLVVAGLARGIGLYAAGVAAAEGARVDYCDSSPRRMAIAESFGARAVPRNHLWRFPDVEATYDIVVDASNLPGGVSFAIRSTAPGGICEVPSYHVLRSTGIPLMHMTFTDITLHVSTSHIAAVLPDAMRWLDDSDFPAERVTPVISDWDQAPVAYGTRKTVKPVLVRPRLGASVH